MGDKTIAFRLMDKEMYTHMDRASENLTIDRGMALHKMIRLMTVSTGGDAYLNFMGNEFGHPEWIDFPREGNGWSYAHARRQWSLAEDGLLRYSWLGAFDRAMLALVKRYGILRDGYPYCLQMDDRNQTIAFSHGKVEGRRPTHLRSILLPPRILTVDIAATASLAHFAAPVPQIPAGHKTGNRPEPNGPGNLRRAP